MLQGRRLCKISLVIIIFIAVSAYSPLDFLGLYAQANYAKEYFTDGSQVTAQGEIYHKEIKNEKAVYYVHNSIISNKTHRLSNISFLFRFDSDSIPLNSKIKLTGTIKHFSPARNDGEFDMQKYYHSMGILFELEKSNLQDLDTGVLPISEELYLLNQDVFTVFEQSLPAEESGFLSSLTIGNKSQLDNGLKDLFKQVGVAHILAVSGLHISVVCMALYRFLRKRGVSFLFSAIIAGIISILYGILTGGSISSIRAIGMFLIFIFAEVLGEAYDTLTALSVMAMWLLIQNPLLITNGSFIFSFCAILGITFVASPLTRIYSEYIARRNVRIKTKDGFSYDNKIPLKIRLKDWICTSLVFSFGINISMLPIVTNMYYEIPLYSMLVNLVVLPFMPILLLFGIVGGFLGILWLPIGQIVLFPCHVIIYGMEMISSFFAGLPLSRIVVGKRGFWLVVIYYIALLLIVKYINKPKLKYAFLLVVSLVWLVPVNNSFEIDCLDVGQGDGIYISSGDGTNYFIDGGSTSKASLGEYTLMPFLKSKGVGQIDYWFLSHMDLDHVSGIIEVLQADYKINNVVLSAAIPPGETLDEILTLAKEKNTTILYMNKGDVCGTKHLRFKCVYPSMENTSDDINALSLALLLEYDKNCDGVPEFIGFFGGDLGIEEEKVIADSGMVGHVNLLKVNHHGSRLSSDSMFLETLSPDVAVISCAKKNRYGHPADEAVERLEQCCSLICYTMNSGRIRIDTGGVDYYLNN